MDKALLITMLVSYVTSNQDPLVIEQQQYVPLAGKDLVQQQPLPGKDLEPQAPLPKFCNGVQCPKFRLIKEAKEYEIRRYPATSWMTTELKGISYKQAGRTMFMRLFRYIQGGNAKGKKIPMTCPVINKIIPGPGATCESDFTMSFYNDPAEGAAPAPSDKTVYVSKLGTVDVYVRSFGGFAEYDQYRDNALKLGKALEKDGLGDTYLTEYYYTAGYDAPYKLFDRHNEVWFMKKP